MFIKTFAVGMLQCNCSILGDLQKGEAIVVDPGDEVDRIIKELDDHKLKPVAIVHTHAHIDHIGGAAELGERTGAPTYLHADDGFLHNMLAIQASVLGFPTPHSAPIDRQLIDSTSLAFGAYELGTIHTPGHTPGSCCFVVPGQDICFAGDTLFRRGVGRTDLWGGDSTQLVRSIRDRLYAQNGSVRVIAGHGPDTTIDEERKLNPYVRLMS